MGKLVENFAISDYLLITAGLFSRTVKVFLPLTIKLGIGS